MSIVLRCVLTSTPLVDAKQKENLFHIGCRINGNLCVLLLDCGSYKNTTTTSMVEELKFPTISHSKPYKL